MVEGDAPHVPRLNGFLKGLCNNGLIDIPGAEHFPISLLLQVISLGLASFFFPFLLATSIFRQV